jgi:FAD/FMN-containing dehydrogenase
MKKTRVAKTFYARRGLEVPRAEYWPESAEALRGLVEETGKSGAPRRVILGNGGHFRGALSAGDEVIRTEKCRAVVGLDRMSGLVEVEAGMRWAELQELLDEEGFSLERYGLYPSTSTIGGLLSMRHLVSKDLYYGDLRDGCVALSAAVAGGEAYRYIPAPRKASGPDFRYLFIGGEGAFGAIVEATFVISRPGDGRLLCWQVDGAAGAAGCAKRLFDLGVRPAWCHYDGAKAMLTVAVLGPKRVLDSVASVARDALGAPVATGDKAALDAERRRLEDGLASATNREVEWTGVGLASLSTRHVGEVVEMCHFSAHRALVALRKVAREQADG